MNQRRRSGANEQRQLDDMIRVIGEWIVSDASLCGKYAMPPNMHAARVILGSALASKLFQMASFRNDSGGATNAIKRAIQTLLDGGELRELPKTQMIEMFGTAARGFMVSRPDVFLRR